MKHDKRTIYWLVTALVLAVTFYFGYFHKSAGEKEPEKIVPVEVEPVSTDSIEETMELTGWIKADSTVVVKSKVAGRIDSLQLISQAGAGIAVEEGLQVEKGRQLAVIDHDVYLAQVESARAGVRAVEVELADAEREKKRITVLYQGGSATQQARDKAVTAAALAEAKLAAVKANLKLAEINLRESKITSPIDGIITAKHIDQGNLINVGEQIVTIADMKTVKIIVGLAEKYAGRVQAGTPVRINVDAFSDRQFPAKVYSIYPAVDQQSRMIQIEIRVDNDKLLLKPGMFARVTLITNQKEDAIVIPRDVVLGGKVDEPYVFVITNSVADKRIVHIGIAQADRYEITDGLNAGESLVVNGMNYLIDGSSVEVVRMEDIE